MSTSSKEQYFFLLYDDFEYYMLLHDPDFFIGFYNPNFPNLRIITKPVAGASYFYNIILREKVELDTPGDPCNPDLEYSFQVCTLLEHVLTRTLGVFQEKPLEPGWLPDAVG